MKIATLALIAGASMWLVKLIDAREESGILLAAGSRPRRLPAKNEGLAAAAFCAGARIT